MSTNSRIILDTDPGIDDAYAILYALAHPDIEVLALTSIFGNVAVDLAAQNALRLVELSDAQVPVAQGAAKPLVLDGGYIPVDIHGHDGFANTNRAEPKGRVSEEAAAELIVRLVRENPGEVTLLPVGPLTNIAAALQMDPDIAALVKRVIVMGGAATVPGNITPVAEANIYNDPHAADAVFQANWPLTMVGLDVTMNLVFSRSQSAALPQVHPKLGQFLAEISPFYADFYAKSRGIDGLVPHDLVALFALTHPEWFLAERGRLAVAIEGPARGATVFWQENRDGPIGEVSERPVHDIMTQFDPSAAYQTFCDILSA